MVRSSMSSREKPSWLTLVNSFQNHHVMCVTQRAILVVVLGRPYSDGSVGSISWMAVPSTDNHRRILDLISRMNDKNHCLQPLKIVGES